MRYRAEGNHWVPMVPRETSLPIVQGDIEPYRSMINGEIITSRSKHRQHLRDHDCIEVGTENQLNAYDNLPDTLSKRRKEEIVRQFQDMSHNEFKALMKRSVQRARGY